VDYIERGTHTDVDVEKDHGLWARLVENLAADRWGVEPEVPL
jgi:hypothetical protein